MDRIGCDTNEHKRNDKDNTHNQGIKHTQSTARDHGKQCTVLISTKQHTQQEPRTVGFRLITAWQK